MSSLAEVTTVQIEFKYLSFLTKNSLYRQKADKVMHMIANIPKTDGLAPMFVNIYTSQFKPSTITIGARGDSYYEYLLKQWILTGKTENFFLDMYNEAVDGIVTHLLQDVVQNSIKMYFISEKHQNGRLIKKMDHLVCFLPGLLALGYHHGLRSPRASLIRKGLSTDLDLAEALMYTCNQMYETSPLGLAAEIVHFNQDGMFVKEKDGHNLLRPETVESLFILYTVTKDSKYQNWGWKIFQAFETHSRLQSGGYSSIKSVLETPKEYRDKMESFFLGETLKYLFLLLADQDKPVLSLDEYVLNTEGKQMHEKNENSLPD